MLAAPSWRILSALVLTLASLSCGGNVPTSAVGKQTTAPTEVAAPAPGTILPGEPETSLPVETDDIVSGEQDAPVTLIAFLDYECGFCSQGFGRLAELRGKYDKRALRIVLKQLPLDFHPEALPAAIAAQSVKLILGDEAALNYSAKLFENQGHLSASAYAVYADEVGVPREQFNELISAQETVGRVATDVMLARRLGVAGTPAFFVNGRGFPGLFPLEDFVSAIDAETNAVQELRKTVDPKSAYVARVRENAARSLVEGLLAEDPATHRVDLRDAPRQGSPNAKVTLVAFSDFECPYCKRADHTLTELQKIYGSDLRIVFKNMPLAFHKHADKSARLALAARRKSGDAAFFSVAEKLFASAPALKDDDLRNIGLASGLTPLEIESALKDTDPGLQAELQADLEQADDLQARSAPLFFINGLRLSGARPLDHFRAIIDEAKRRATEYATAHPGEDVYLGITKDGALPGAPTKIQQSVPVDGNPSRGGGQAKVTIHMFSDFECPYCRKAEPLVQELEKAFPGQLRWVWHDLPLDFHERAEPAARIGQLIFQEKGSAAFFRYHDAVFALDEAQPKLSNEALLSIAQSLGVSAAKAREILEASSRPQALVDDGRLAESLGIRGTPAFIVGGYLVVGAQPQRHFERLIRLALKEAASTPKN